MRIYVISDNTDTQMGLRLSGISGVVVHEREELMTALEHAMRDPEIGIILITEKLVSLAKDHIYNIKSGNKLPLIIEIPDRHSDVSKRDSITAYINEALGVKF
jgi:V/A-type H+-transporting ATPase subunit F